MRENSQPYYRRMEKRGLIFILLGLIVSVVYFLITLNQEESFVSTTSSESNRLNSKPIILEWNRAGWYDIPFNDSICAEECIFTRDRSFEANATVITFFYPWLNIKTLPKIRDHSKSFVFVSFESPSNYPYKKEISDDYFNTSFTYRLNSDISKPYDCFKNLTINDTDRWTQKEVSLMHFLLHNSPRGGLWLDMRKLYDKVFIKLKIVYVYFSPGGGMGRSRR